MGESVSVIATVYNEAGSIDSLLQSLLAQTRQPGEIVIVDGGSTDGTLEALRTAAHQVSLPLKVLSQPGCNISEGRNRAIASARGPIIASTDAGVRLEEGWLAALMAPFDREDPPDVVSGFFAADPHSLFELALGAVTLPRREEIDPKSFHPSSRSIAFRREAWQAVGGYPEWLDYCEDLVFDFALEDTGYRFCFAPEALAHFRPRQSLRVFVRQYYRYARGDGRADLWRLRHLARYGAYLGGIPVGLTLAVLYHPAWLLVLVVGLGAMLRKPLRRLLPDLRERPWPERLRAIAWLPVLRVAGDLAKMLGYPVGTWWRWRHAPKEAWPKRQF